MTCSAGIFRQLTYFMIGPQRLYPLRPRSGGTPGSVKFSCCGSKMSPEREQMRMSEPARFYRCYLLNSDNSLRKTQEFRCPSESEAKERAIAWLDLAENDGARGLELWKRDRCLFIRRRGEIVARASTD